MKKVELISKGKFAVTDHELPSILNPDDVLLKIEYVGVCGSDIHYYSTGKIGDQIIDYPFVIGHECSATVVEIGAKVSKVSINDTVCIEPLYSCGKCEQCKIGRKHTCLNQKFMGCPGQMDGGLAEYIVLPEKMCIPFPKEMNQKQAVIVEPFAIGLYTSKFVKNPSDKRIAILGFGPIGISVFLALRHIGCSKISISDLIKERREIAKELGIINIFDPSSQNYIDDLLAIGEKYDVVVDCCGEQSALDVAQNIIKPGGQLLLVGIPELDTISFNPHFLRRNEVTVQNVRRQNNCVEEAIELIASKQIDIDFMISHIFKMDETDKAFNIAAKYKDGVIKALIKV